MYNILLGFKFVVFFPFISRTVTVTLLFFFIIIKLVPHNHLPTFSSHNLFQSDSFNTTIPTVKQTLMKTVARHFSALTFLSRHFQYLKHYILIKVSQDLHTKNKESFIENKSAKSGKNVYHQQSFHWNRFWQFFADILRHRTLHITHPFFLLLIFNMSFHFHFSLFPFLCLFSSFSLSFVKAASLMTNDSIVLIF